MPGLDEYSRKRKFDKTPEPGPDLAQAPELRFCVQRHHARRLHYDLRIEVGGTLKSWAVPNGPSLDPAVKSLAVHVEDHPVEYSTFEGNIPKGNYGGGSMMLWDAGTYRLLGEGSAEEQLARGDFKFHLNGEKLRGDYALVRMKDRKTGGEGNEWLLIKKKDAFVRTPYDIEEHGWSVKSGRTQEEIALELAAKPIGKMPSTIVPMLAQLSSDLPSGDGWLYEIKWDGVRSMAFIEEGKVRLTGRKGNDISRSYPELAGLAEWVGGRSVILDGEIAVLDDKGRPSFERIQPRIMAVDAGAIRQHMSSRPAIFFAFDLLYLDGRDLRGTPLLERKQKLATILTQSNIVRLSEHFDGHGAELLNAARQQSLEGVVAKRADSFYESSRSRDWQKVKAVRDQELVICGFTKGERDYFGSLLLGVLDGGVLRYAGNVGTGFDNALMKQIHALLKARITDGSPFQEVVKLPQPITWVRPELVATIKYLEWTADGRLRAPVFVGLRNDIDPSECVRSSAPPAETRQALLPAEKDEAAIDVDGHRMRIKNLNKVFYPPSEFNDKPYSKRDVINYYDAIAEFLIPYWQDRPLSLRRYPDGIHGEAFFQKNAEGLPDWIRTTTLEEGNEVKVRVVGNDRAELVYLAQLGCIDQNPWMSRVDSLDTPDFLLIDLDPQECSFDKILEAAHVVRRTLETIGLTGYPKTTGGDGMHIYVPLEPVYTYEQSKSFCEIIARLCASERPELFTTPRAVSKRDKDKVYFDYLQNGRAKTISAPYVLRAYPGAPVATPLDWSEVKTGIRPQQFHIRNSLDRFRRTGDLFSGVLTKLQRLETALERVASYMAQKQVKST